jgi:hypothetical protein
MLTARSRALLTYCLLNVEICPLIVELRGLVREHLVQLFCFSFNSALASVYHCCGNSIRSVRCSGNVFSFFVALVRLAVD